MTIKKLALVTAASLVVTGCMSTKSMTMKATGAKEGELPQFERHDYQVAQSAFRANLPKFRRTGKLPVDTTGFVTCDVDVETVQRITGYTDLLRSLQKSESTADDSSSLASQAANAAGSAGSAVSVSQTYHWQYGSVEAKPTQCDRIAADHSAPGLKYLVDSQYVMRTTANESHMTHTTTTRSFVDNLENGAAVHMTASSTKAAGGRFDSVMSRAVVSMNALDEPMFSYSYAFDGDMIAMFEPASQRGLYMTRVTKDVGEGRKRSHTYQGKELTMITRSRNGKPHGQQEFIKFDLPSNCFDNGEIVQVSNCERF